jgi:hypothetical protein
MQIAGIDKLVRVGFKRFDPGYFPHTRKSGSLRPRHQQRRLRWNSRVIVINEVLVTRLKDIGGMKDPVGKVVRVSYPGYEGG